MPTKRHYSHNNDSVTNRLILISVFSTIGTFIAMMLVVHLLRWLFRKHTQDLEAHHHPLLSEGAQTTYDTFAPSSQDAPFQNPELRRMLRRDA
ncbi:hypothetical protein SVAN01_10604 [Stagonosporopsis vannaccii]|nr:hypothetical protein SVAN01_10604 [Stagonosporopsis vannaccii]